jgi:solute carrier family 30 (zinc transporter), member 1
MYKLAIEKPYMVLIVGIIGLAVNVFGMFLFHEGHGHSHGGLGGGHGHSHGSQEKTKRHSIDSHHSHGTAHGHSHGDGHSHSDGHSHGNVNDSNKPVIEIEPAARDNDVTAERAAENDLQKDTLFPLATITTSADASDINFKYSAQIRAAILTHASAESLRASPSRDSIRPVSRLSQPHSHQGAGGAVSSVVHEGQDNGFVVSTQAGDDNHTVASNHSHSHGHPRDSHDNHSHSSGHSHDDHGHASSKPKKNLNMHGIFLHLLGDALGSVGVIISSLVIILTSEEWSFYLDPIVSILISGLIITSTLPLIRSASSILLQGTYSHLQNPH